MKDAGRAERSEVGTTLVCFALEDEARVFRKRMAGRSGVSILITGIGAKNAERSTRTYLQQNCPQQVFSCGFAGGLDPKLKVGDVAFQTPNESLAKKLQQCGAASATFHCASRIATTANEKAELRRATGKDAVEMESEAIHTICRERDIPCAIVRVISDAAHEDLPLDFNQLSNPDQSLNFGKLGMAIAKSPGKISALLRLQKNTSLAAKRLAETLARVVA